MKIIDLKYLKDELSPIFSKKYLREDIVAGITVASVAIPLSLAIAMASGLDPAVGLISAIIGGIVAALLGGTTLAVTGPTATMAVLIANVVSNYGVTGLVVCGLICGILQIISGILNLGKYTRMVPLSAVSAFTAAIGFIIIIGQLPKALQLPPPSESKVLDVIVHIGNYITHMSPMSFVLALLTLIILKTLPRYFPKVPAPLVAVAIPTAIVLGFGLNNVTLVGQIPHTLPMPSLPDFKQISDWNTLISSGFEVFLLASLETLLSSAAVDSMGVGDLHNSNQELIGQGSANFLVALFGGLPVTGVIARSSINIATGAKTRRSAILHSLILVVVIYLAPKLIEVIPITALAGVLLAAGLSMISLDEIIKLWKIDKAELITYIATFLAIIMTDLVQGIKAGMIVAFVIVAVRMLAARSNTKLWANDQVLRISLSGNMTFWSFDKLNKLEHFISTHIKLKVVIFDFTDVRGIDLTGANHLENLARSISSTGLKVIFHDLRDDQEKLFSENKRFIQTITEHDIKMQLEHLGIAYHARESLQHGAAKFIVNYAKERKDLLNELAQGQKPHTLLITCSDSRIDPNALFSANLGELFIIRNAGNIVTPFEENGANEVTSAIEFAIGALSIRNIVICAHSDCGAIKACVNGTKTPYNNLNNWLDKINQQLQSYAPLDVNDAILRNLLNQLDNLKHYPLIKQLMDKKELSINAWIYDVQNAQVLRYSYKAQAFKPLVSDDE